MIVTLSLLGFYILLWVPFVGHLLSHAIHHYLAHQLDHHETAFAATLVSLFWLLLLAVPGTAFLGWWRGLADAVLAFLILLRFFSGGH